jgi:hypothetical protein
MDYLFQDGGKPKAKKSKTGSKTTKSKTTTKTTKSKSSSKTGTKTTKSKTTSKKSSSKKGGNFLGTVGDLVAPTGWGPFATAAGLLALDRADAALRRGKSTKSSAKKGGMRGGNDFDDEANRILVNDNKLHKMFKSVYKYSSTKNTKVADCKKIDDFINREIQNRNNLMQGMEDTALKQRIRESIPKLEFLKITGTNSPNPFNNNRNLSTSEQEIREYYEIFERLYRKPKYT